MQSSEQEESKNVSVIFADASGNRVPDGVYSVCWGIFTGYIGRFYSETTALGSIYSRTERSCPESNKREVRLNELLFRAENYSHDCFLGKLHRSAITGSIIYEDLVPLEKIEYVDLAGRDQVRGQVQDILNDGRIFKAEALVVRSWLYQDRFESETGFRNTEEESRLGGRNKLRSLNDIRMRSLTESVVEFQGGLAPVFSSSLAVGISVLVGLFSLDKSVFIILIVLWIATVVVSVKTNMYSRILIERPITMLPRVAVAVWIVSLRLIPYKENYKPVSDSEIPWILRMITGIILALDLVIGDIRQIILYTNRSRKYSVRKIFPDTPRVFVCENPQPAKVTHILPAWIDPDQQSGLCLIADIHGILHRIDPIMGPEDLPNPITTPNAIRMASISLKM